MAYVVTAGRSPPQRRQGAIRSGSNGGSNGGSYGGSSGGSNGGATSRFNRSGGGGGGGGGGEPYHPEGAIAKPTKARPDHCPDHPDDPIHPLSHLHYPDLHYPDGIASAMDAAEVAISLRSRSARIARDSHEIARGRHEIATRSPRDPHGRRGGQRHRPESAA